MKVQKLFDQGDAKIIEDGSFMCYPFFGVLDGVSPSYTPKEGPKKYCRLSGGQMVVEIVANTFSLLSKKFLDLDFTLQKANDAVRKWALLPNLPIEQTDKLPATALAVAFIEEEFINIIIAGDCIAIWQMKDGKTGASENRTFFSEKEQEDKFAELMRKYDGNRQKCWEEFIPFQDWSYRTYRNKLVPNGFGVLNGQPEFCQLLQRYCFFKEEIKTLILATDGFVPMEMTKNSDLLSKKVLESYALGGLPKLLSDTRLAEKAKHGTSWTTDREATAIAIEF